MARYNGLIIPRSYNDYYSRSDPQAIRDIVLLAADGELNAESKNPLQNQAIAKIVPNTASETNELADKNFVNSTVGTNTANYIYKTESGGEKVPFSSVAELEAYAGTVTNNDYAFVTGIDENGNAYYDRYKAYVNDGVVTWAKEYRLNNSSFTAEQWAAIQSGITAEKVAQFEGAVSPVDNVQSGNMSAVTSNAVYEALTNYCIFVVVNNLKCNYTKLNGLVNAHFTYRSSTEMPPWTSFINLPVPLSGYNIKFKIGNGDSNYNMYILGSSGLVQNESELPAGVYYGSVSYEYA